MPIIIDTRDLADFCARISGSTYVTVDTEFMRENTFWPRLFVVQVAGDTDAQVIDALADGIDLAPLYELMANPNILKVFHAARQDLEIFYNAMKRLPVPIFDTQVAAMVCGFGDSISYVNLVKKVSGKNLDKSSRFTDWARRPLSQKQLQYALGDVTHLREIYRHLKSDLAATGRAH
jgi:ribonuclease D